MIYNATILQIATPLDPTPGGDAQFSSQSVGVRCCIDEPTFNQRFEIQQAELDATVTVYLERSLYPADIPAGSKLSVQGDRQSAAIVYLVRRSKKADAMGATDHQQMYCGRA